jgi:transposase
MSVPGANVQTAATFMAVIGEIRGFASSGKLVSYLGLDPRVRQSGRAPAGHGRISTAGASEHRHMFGEVAWKVMRTRGPLRAFFERARARTARSRERAQAHGAVLASAHERTGLRLRPAGDDPPQDPPARCSQAHHHRRAARAIVGGKSKAVFDAECELSRPAETAYRRLVSDWKAAAPSKTGAGTTPGRASPRPSKGKAARQTP